MHVHRHLSVEIQDNSILNSALIIKSEYFCNLAKANQVHKWRPENNFLKGLCSLTNVQDIVDRN